jgi:hypothetical protein
MSGVAQKTFQPGPQFQVVLLVLYLWNRNVLASVHAWAGTGFMRSRAAEYRQNAAKCLRVAEDVSDHAARRELLAMARAWHNLASQAERNSQVDLVYETPAREQQQIVQQQQQIQPDTADENEESTPGEGNVRRTYG